MFGNNGKTFLQAAALGTVAGMRSASAPAVVSSYLAQHQEVAADGSLLRYLSTPLAAKTLRLMAVGEMVVDKLPFVPARTEAPSVITRIISGGLAGAVVGRVYRRNVIGASVIGALAAVGATYGAYHIRKQAAEETAVPDPLLGLLEDLTVAGISYYLIHRPSAPQLPGPPSRRHETPPV